MSCIYLASIIKSDINTQGERIGDFTPSTYTALKVGFALDVILFIGCLGMGVTALSGGFSLPVEASYILVGIGITYVLFNLYYVIYLKKINFTYNELILFSFNPLRKLKPGENLNATDFNVLKEEIKTLNKISKIVSGICLLVASAVVTIGILGMHNIVSLPSQASYMVVGGGTILGMKALISARLSDNEIKNAIYSYIIASLAVSIFFTLGFMELGHPSLSKILLGSGIYLTASILLGSIDMLKTRKKAHKQLVEPQMEIVRPFIDGLAPILEARNINMHQSDVYNLGCSFAPFVGQENQRARTEFFSRELFKQGIFSLVKEDETDRDAYMYLSFPHAMKNMTATNVPHAIGIIQQELEKIEEALVRA